MNSLLLTFFFYKRVMCATLAVGLLAASAGAFSARDTNIIVTIEEPVMGESYAGISNLRGWAVAPAGIGDYNFEVYIDGQFAFDIPVGGNRGDVASQYPDYPNSDKSGFSMAFNYKNLSPGEHEIRVVAFDNNGEHNDATASFSTERFVSSFIADDSKVDLTTTKKMYYLEKQNAYLITGVTVEGEEWNFQLSWDRASQGFKTKAIRPRAPEDYCGTHVSESGTCPSTTSGETTDFASGYISESRSFDFTAEVCRTSPSTGEREEEVRYDNGMLARNYLEGFLPNYGRAYIFKTESAEWWAITDTNFGWEGFTDLWQLEVVEPPTSCLATPHSTVSLVETIGSDDDRRQYGETLFTISDVNGPWLAPFVDSSCRISVGSPVLLAAIAKLNQDTYPYPLLSIIDLKTREICNTDSWYNLEPYSK
jgi:hypothetical protein